MNTFSSGPDIGVFSRLKERWVSIDQSQPEPPTPDELPPSLRSKRDFLLQEWVALFSNSHLRDDYKEMLELFVVLLCGDDGIPKVKFRRPGAHAPRSVDGISGPGPEVAYSPARARGRMPSTVEGTRSPTGQKDGQKWLHCS